MCTAPQLQDMQATLYACVCVCPSLTRHMRASYVSARNVGSTFFSSTTSFFTLDFCASVK